MAKMNFERLANNQSQSMTRRYPDLPAKVLRRDSEIAKRIIYSWDTLKNPVTTLEIFMKEAKHLSHQRYWELLRTVWILCGAVHNQEAFRGLMQSSRPHRYYFSTPEDAAHLRGLPDELVIYRATNDPNDNGLSWTTFKEYAERYSVMFGKTIILESPIFKSQIFALINRNREYEVIIL